MGLDLTLLPLLSQNYWVAHTMLPVERNGHLFKCISELKQKDMPVALSCFMARTPSGESQYGQITEDKYGNDLKWVTAERLCTLRRLGVVCDYWQIRAIWAYLSELPEDWPIVLYWH